MFEDTRQPKQANEVNALFADIAEYNSHYSLGRALAEMLRAATHDSPQPSADEIAQSQKDKALVILGIHHPLLERLGISLEPVAGKTWTRLSITSGPLGDNVAKFGDSQIRINITDAGKFCDYLASLDPAQISGTEFGQNMKTLVHTLVSQVRDHYDLNSPGDSELELLRGLRPLIDEYRRLGLSDAVESLAVYLDMSERRCLREYLLIEQAGLLAEPGKGFGPADWQNDATIEYLQRRWDEALDTLREIKANPNADALYDKTVAHLSKCLKIACTTTESADWQSRRPQHRELRQILNLAAAKLEFNALP